MSNLLPTGGQPSQTALATALAYLRRGWQPIPIAHRSKNPNKKGWENLRLTESELPNYFNGAPQNIGVLLGSASNGLTDIDLDSRAAVLIADYFLPETKAVFGRDGKPRSHRLYISNFPKTKKFEYTETIVEIRSTGGQTVFPGSTHISGETIEWQSNGEPCVIDAETLHRATARLASACLISTVWQSGKRNDLNLALSGALLRHGFDVTDAKNFIRAVCAAANDEETEARLVAVDATAAKIKNGENVSGFKSLIELTDLKFVETVRKWLEIEYQPEHKTELSCQHETAEPIPLPENILPAPQLDDLLLPDEWREWLTDISERMQCPLDFPAVAAIVAAAALIGNKVRIRPKKFDTWQVTPNLWGAVVGPPSVLKSPAVTEGMFFFREIENRERAAYESAMKDADFDKEFAEAKKGDLKKQMRDKKANKEDLRLQFQAFEVDEPKEKRLSTSDATVEKLGELLNENENGILQIRDELTGWFRGLERSGREGDRAFYLECWDGGGISKIDRIGRGSKTAKNLTLSIFGTIQPAMLEPYLRGSIEGYGDDGLIQRFQLLVYPNSPRDYRFVDRIPKGRDRARESFKGLYDIEPDKIGAKQFAEEFGGGYFVQFDAAAQEFFQVWLTELETDLRSDTFDTTAFASHVAKYRSLMPTLALIFHLLDCVSNNQSNEVSLENAQKAAAWCSYLQAHAERIYRIARLSEFDVARAILKKIKEKKLGSEFTARDVYLNHWSNLGDPNKVREALGILTEYGYLQFVTVNTGGKKKDVYLVNESLK